MTVGMFLLLPCSVQQCVSSILSSCTTPAVMDFNQIRTILPFLSTWETTGGIWFVVRSNGLFFLIQSFFLETATFNYQSTF